MRKTVPKSDTSRFEALLSVSSLAVWVADAQGNLVEDSESWRHLTGQPLDQSRGAGWFDAVHPEDRSRVRSDWQHAIKHGEVFKLEFRVWAARGSSFHWVRAFGTPVRDSHRHITEWIVAHSDVTDERESREALLESTKLSALRSDVAGFLNASEDIQPVLQNCTDALVNRLGVAFARIWTVNAAGDMLELKASSGLYTHLNGGHARVPVGKFKIGLIAKEKSPHLTNEVIGDPRVPEQAWAKTEKLVAFAGYPLMIEQRVLGVMAMFSRKNMSSAVLKELAPIGDALAQWLRRRALEEDRHRLLLESRARDPLASSSPPL